MSSGKRITILSQDEHDYLYGIPELTNKDRVVIFDLSQEDHEAINQLSSDAVKIDYILQLGYLRAKQFLFNFTFQQVRQDVWFIINNYFPDVAFPKKKVSKHYHYDNQKRLLKRFNYQPFTSKKNSPLQQQAIILARRHVHPRFVFDELLGYCQQCNLIRPGYSTMQDIVSVALQTERDRVLNRMSLYLGKSARLALDSLLKNDDRFYQITLIKKDPKDFSTQEMRKEVS